MHWNWNDGWSGCDWTLMTIMMVGFWGFVLWAIVAAVRSPNRSGRVGRTSAEAILAERLASGEIGGKEYQHSLDLIRSSNAHPPIEARPDGLRGVSDRPSDKSNT